MTGRPDADASPQAVARSFVDAVIWGEHLVVWELLGSSARARVLRVATDRGMDEGLAGRLRTGTASRHEHDVFLTDLVNGLRADLDGADLDQLDVQLGPALSDVDAARITLVAALPEPLGDLPVGSYELRRHEGRWQIDEVHVLRAPR